MKLVNYTVADRIGRITLNRPEKRNALNFEMVSELKAAFATAEADPDAKVIVLSGEGEAFCAGADLSYLQSLQKFSFEENLNDSRHLKDLFVQIYTLRKVVIGQVQGSALAGGFGLATVCDFVFAAPEARFGYTEARIGFVPAIVMVFLLRKIGEQSARRLLLGAEQIQAHEAMALGLLAEIIPRESLSAAVTDFASSLIKNNSGQSMELIKQMISDIQSRPLDDALEYAATMNAKARATEDCRKGIASFLQKKTLLW